MSCLYEKERKTLHDDFIIVHNVKGHMLTYNIKGYKCYGMRSTKCYV
jgi:hypothetical protein